MNELEVYYSKEHNRFFDYVPNTIEVEKIDTVFIDELELCGSKKLGTSTCLLFSSIKKYPGAQYKVTIKDSISILKKCIFGKIRDKFTFVVKYGRLYIKLEVS